MEETYHCLHVNETGGLLKMMAIYPGLSTVFGGEENRSKLVSNTREYNLECTGCGTHLKVR